MKQDIQYLLFWNIKKVDITRKQVLLFKYVIHPYIIIPIRKLKKNNCVIITVIIIEIALVYVYNG